MTAQSLRLRIARPADAAALAEVYYRTASSLRENFLPKLGISFLTRYHRVLLAEPHSLVLCLEDCNGKVVGLASGTLATEEHIAALSRNRISLGLSAAGAILRSPSLLRGMYSRFRSARGGNTGDEFISSGGPRIEYWGCLEGAVAPADAVNLIRAWLESAARLGAVSLRCEVDDTNRRVRRVHEVLGAVLDRTFVTGDGRQRFILKYDLTEEKTRRRIGV